MTAHSRQFLAGLDHHAVDMTGIPLLALRRLGGFGFGGDSGGFSGGDFPDRGGGFSGGGFPNEGSPEGGVGVTFKSTTPVAAAQDTPASRPTPAAAVNDAAPVSPSSTPTHTTSSSPPSKSNPTSEVSSQLPASSHPSSSSRSTAPIKSSSSSALSISSSLPSASRSQSSPSGTAIAASASFHKRSNHAGAIAGALVPILLLLLLATVFFVLRRRRRIRAATSSDVEKIPHDVQAAHSISESKGLPPIPTIATEGYSSEMAGSTCDTADSLSFLDEKSCPGEFADGDEELPLPPVPAVMAASSGCPVEFEAAPSFHTLGSEETLPGYARPLPRVPDGGRPTP
ncbi:hypothetical protein FB45DRAFT_920499 [Roridomyces roridus]|uniref:Uncharacterized protein n=1 Tax=Roridomyces roridus TaxID=1738132 RepID=A0AAD7BQD6_9AGAR|nr:hypothetical protein FB45DRAFT_920499 [Roridomyces roridus]